MDWTSYIGLLLVSLCLVCQAAAPVPLRTEDEAHLPRIDFVKEQATLTEAITAVAIQSRVPLGVILGRDKTPACSTMYRFDLHEVGANRALVTVAHEAHFTVGGEDGVIILTAPDVSPRQRLVLAHRFVEFRAPQDVVAAEISAQLAGRLWTDMDHGTGFGGSTLSSFDEPKISLPSPMREVTTEEIANRVVTTGAGGIWIAKINPDRAQGPMDEIISFYSYGNTERLKQEISCG